MKFLVMSELLLLGILAYVHSSTATTCTITTYNENAIEDATENCDVITIDEINVPGGVPLQLNLKEGAQVIFQGIITWEFYQWNGPLVNITGTNVDISGAPGHLLDVRGYLWWDSKREGGEIIKPVSFVVHTLHNSTLHDINFKNPPLHAIWIENSDGVIARDIFVDNSDGDRLGGKNTNGINVWTSNNVTIERLTVYNQGDCVAIKSGTNVVVKDSFCSGDHGISIGSVGGRDYNVVENVSVSNIDILGSDNGITINTNYGTTGPATNVTYTNITLERINEFGISVHGNYGNREGIATGSVPIKELSFNNVTGTVKETGCNVYILVKNATDWYWDDVDCTGAYSIGNVMLFQPTVELITIK